MKENQCNVLMHIKILYGNSHGPTTAAISCTAESAQILVMEKVAAFAAMFDQLSPRW